jgi:hypothetical protein
VYGLGGVGLKGFLYKRQVLENLTGSKGKTFKNGFTRTPLLSSKIRKKVL